ncbi:LysM peptidoglycan-binding domain-containing protein [Paenibacillus beijingensis]|uniref:LysM peptidoglycan-binding domain-containing protein n=1 Tax=Paenibacillus beijingensis TaxID=1126833 RepID=UPI000A60FBAC|nr:LysM domain-containing protein [Paenibacillus beijingensis]
MHRAFTPFGGPGFRRPFRPFPHPFFPGRFLFPFFFFFPFFFPFFRDEDGGNEIFTVHQAQAGDTLEKISHMYNMPYPIIEEANPHIGNPKQMTLGESVYIPRISHLYCHKTYMEREDSPNVMYPTQTMPFQAGPNPMHK